jgi:hypothetical protein
MDFISIKISGAFSHNIGYNLFTIITMHCSTVTVDGHTTSSCSNPSGMSGWE